MGIGLLAPTVANTGLKGFIGPQLPDDIKSKAKGFVGPLQPKSNGRQLQTSNSYDVFNTPNASLKMIAPDQLPKDLPASGAERLMTALANSESASFQVGEATLGGKRVLVAKANPGITAPEGYYGAFQTMPGGSTAGESGAATKGKYRLDDPSLKNQALASLGMMLNNYQVPAGKRDAIFASLASADKAILAQYKARKQGDMAGAKQLEGQIITAMRSANQNIPAALWGGALAIRQNHRESGDKCFCR
jgi:hypothetical protein